MRQLLTAAIVAVSAIALPAHAPVAQADESPPLCAHAGMAAPAGDYLSGRVRISGYSRNNGGSSIVGPGTRLVADAGSGSDDGAQEIDFPSSVANLWFPSLENHHLSGGQARTIVEDGMWLSEVTARGEHIGAHRVLMYFSGRARLFPVETVTCLASDGSDRTIEGRRWELDGFVSSIEEAPSHGLGYFLSIEPLVV